MMIVIGVASALGRARVAAAMEASIFLTDPLGSLRRRDDLFGLADIVTLLGYWPKPTRTIAAELSAARDRALRRRHLRHFAHFLRAQDVERSPILSSPRARRSRSTLGRCRRSTLRQSLYARINMFFLILINQFQVAIGVRLNFFYRAFGNAIQVPDAAHGASSGTSCSGFRAAGHDLDPGVPGRVLRRAELRPAMAALDDRVLHVALAPAFDALQAGARAARTHDRQPGPAHLRRHRRLHQRHRRPAPPGTRASTTTPSRR